jgi:hypothetical protein
MDVYTVFKKEWDSEKERERYLKVGIWAKFLEWVGISAETGLTVDKNGRDLFSFQKLEVKFMERISQTYLEKSMQQDAVTNYLTDNPGKPVFLITGVMIAHEAAASSVLKNKAAVNAKVGIGGAVIGAPGTSVGPEFQAVVGKKDGESYKDSDDFVFAYRIRRVFFEKSRVKSTAYNVAARYGLGEGEDKDADAEDEAKAKPAYKFDKFSLASEDFSGGTRADASLIEAEDDFDGEACKCIVPTSIAA